MSTDFLMDDNCFACGKDNPHGLHLEIKDIAEGVEAYITPPAWVQSYKDTVHGGIIATILDEMAVWAAYKKGYKCVTAELIMRVRQPMAVDSSYIARASVKRVKHRLVHVESTITSNTDEVVASAQAKLMRLG
jgi:acyl-coenzyme A thioesterase PaaI-like protein